MAAAAAAHEGYCYVWGRQGRVGTGTRAAERLAFRTAAAAGYLYAATRRARRLVALARARAPRDGTGRDGWRGRGGSRHRRIWEVGRGGPAAGISAQHVTAAQGSLKKKNC